MSKAWSESSYPIWYEHVDASFLRLLWSVLTMDGKERKYGGKPLKVSMRRPDEDFYDEDYPLVTVHFLYDEFAKDRYDPEPTVLHRYKQKNSMLMQESALPFNLYYQIDFWATHQSDMNKMLRQWKSFAKSWFNLDIWDTNFDPDDPNKQRFLWGSCLVLSKNDFRRADLLKGGKRVFHSFCTYKVQMELDDRDNFEVPMVTSVPNISVNGHGDSTEGVYKVKDKLCIDYGVRAEQKGNILTIY